MFKEPIDGEEAPPHPGEILREDILPCLELSQRDLALHLGIPDDTLAQILNEQVPVTSLITGKLGRAFGQGAHHWLGLQVQYDLWQASRMLPVAVQPIPWRKRATRPAARPSLPSD